MAQIAFKRATKAAAKLRLALIGVSGSGKTFSALSIARGIGKKVAVLDTEHGSAAKYADQFEFDTLELEDFDPANYVGAIEAAERAGYDVLIIDSLTHAWSGTGGILEQKDRAGAGFDAWRKLTPKHNALVDAIVGSKLHVIATMRSKQEYAVEINERGKAAPKKLGMGAVQRDGMEYEFDVVGFIDEAALTITKTRYPRIAGKVIQRPGESLGLELAAWLSDGTAPVARPALAVVTSPPADESAPVAQPEVSQPAPEPQADPADALVRSVTAAASLHELEKVVLPKIQAAGLSGESRAKVATAYSARRTALVTGSAK